MELFLTIRFANDRKQRIVRKNSITDRVFLMRQLAEVISLTTLLLFLMMMLLFMMHLMKEIG
jgi:hypothetical protein